MDCDLFTEAIDTVAGYLSSRDLHYIAVNGGISGVNEMEAGKVEQLFLNWNESNTNKGLIFSFLGALIPAKRLVPAEAVKGKLQAVRRQIEARQQQLQLEVTAQRAIASPAPARKRSVSEPKIAKLAPGLEPNEVRAMLKNLGLGSIFDNSGEWAAAFRALLVAGVLTGNAPATLRWAIEHVHLDSRMKETFKRLWQHELSEEGQFANDAQRVVFRNVLAAAQRLLSTKGHK